MVYREALEQACSSAYEIREAWWQKIQAHAKVGLCNGFYFGQSGQLYIGNQQSAVGNQLKVIS